jgi:hypothetical protein
VALSATLFDRKASAIHAADGVGGVAAKDKMMSEKTFLIPVERIEHSILLIREQKVMLDKDLALLYGVEAKRLIQAVKRNILRFPEDFMFQLTWEEACYLEITICILTFTRCKLFKVTKCDLKAWRTSQVPPLRLHRTGSSHALQRPAKPPGRVGEHRDYAGLRAAAADVVLARRSGAKSQRPGEKVRRSVQNCL